jgi:opacity protein-like surface antigen
MKRLKILVAAVIAAAMPSLAHAQWYAGADGGANFVQDSNLSGNGTSAKAGSDTGYVIQGHAGYAFTGPGFGTPRIEGEVGYRSSGLKSLSNVNGTVSGQTTALSLMVNGAYQFLPKSSWHPFVGAGLGMARIGVDWRDGNGTLVEGTDWVFAYQGFAGVSYDVTKNWELTAQYRYFATEDPEFTSAAGVRYTGEYSSHAVMAGVSYKLGK